MQQSIVNTALQSFNFQNWKILVESYRISILWYQINTKRKTPELLLSLRPTPMLISKTAYKSICFPDGTGMQWFMIFITFVRQSRDRFSVGHVWPFSEDSAACWWCLPKNIGLKYHESICLSFSPLHLHERKDLLVGFCQFFYHYVFFFFNVAASVRKIRFLNIVCRGQWKTFGF